MQVRLYGALAVTFVVAAGLLIFVLVFNQSPSSDSVTGQRNNVRSDERYFESNGGRPARTDPNREVSAAADPAILLLQSVANQSENDAWNQSLKQLKNSVAEYEQQADLQQTWMWLQQQSSTTADHDLRTLNEQLNALQQSLNDLQFKE